MTKTPAIAGLLAMFLAANAPAQDSERITALEKEVQELKLRLSRLEASPDASEKKPPPAALVRMWRPFQTGRN